MKIIRGKHPVPIWISHPLPTYLEEALRQFEETASVQALAYPLDVVDAAIFDYLMPGVRWQGSGDALPREEITPGITRYSMYDADLGDLGTVTLRKLGHQRTRIQFDFAPLPNPREPTPEEQRKIDALGLGIWQEEIDLQEKIRDEQEVHARWCRAAYASHVVYFLEQFTREQMWAKRLSPLEGESSSLPTPQEKYDQYIFEATQRAQQNGLSRHDHPKHHSGPDAIFDWFVAYWVPTNNTLEQFIREYLSGETSKEARRRWDVYRKKYKIPTFTELKNLRGQKI